MFYAGFQFNMMNTIIHTILQISEKMPQVSKNQLKSSSLDGVSLSQLRIVFLSTGVVPPFDGLPIGLEM